MVVPTCTFGARRRHVRASFTRSLELLSFLVTVLVTMGLLASPARAQGGQFVHGGRPRGTAAEVPSEEGSQHGQLDRPLLPAVDDTLNADDRTGKHIGMGRFVFPVLLMLLIRVDAWASTRHPIP
ncbi:MAG: hypothetical protein ABR606_00110 [Vicinamibacterales bacterium]